MELEHQIAKALEMQRETARLASNAKRSTASFVLQELATGLTFVQLARDSEKRSEAENASRQKAAAREALQTVLKLLPEVEPTPIQKAQIAADLAELDSKLKALGP